MRLACLAAGLLWISSVAAEALYRLPWADGLSFMFTQAPGGQITSHFTKAMLYAVDIAMPKGSAVVAARAGTVEAVERRHGEAPDEDPITYEGNFVRVRHADGTAALYAHLKHDGVAVVVGDTVREGELLGYSGATGDAQYPHLHFVVTRTQKNPAGWVEEVSLPVTFYVGVPPVTFAPQPALSVAANYSGPAQMPWTASQAPRFNWQRPVLEPQEEAMAWALLMLWLAACAVGVGWFWRFARKEAS